MSLLRNMRSIARKADVPSNLHHRKPRSKGGKATVENLVIVEIKKHQLWNILFSNKQPFEIACDLQYTLMPHFRVELKLVCVKTGDVRVVPPGKLIGCGTRKGEAWGLMFEDMGVEEILQIINDVWLDPDYRIELKEDS